MQQIIQTETSNIWYGYKSFFPLSKKEASLLYKGLKSANDTNLIEELDNFDRNLRITKSSALRWVNERKMSAIQKMI